MKVVRLGEAYSTVYQPDKVIEGYSSMIFTERFQTPGDFELMTYKISQTAALLPVDTLISHLGTDDVHIVETHDIEVDEQGRPQLKITGRSLDMMVEHRYVEGRYGKKRTMARQYSNSGALSVLLYQAFDNSSGKDVTREGDQSWNTTDKIPNVVITESATDDGTNKRRWLVKGPLAPQLEEIKTKGDLGIRVIRPHDGSNATVVTVDAFPQDDRGTIIRTVTTGITSLRFDVYNGVDKTDDVEFRTLHGDVDKAQYLLSKKDHKTAVELMTSVGVSDVYRNNTERDFTGIKRRVAALDVGEPDIDPEPERPQDPRKNATKAEREAYQDALDDWRTKHGNWKTKSDRITAEFKEDVIADGERLLKDTKVVSMMTGDISPLAPYKYGVDYGLGDKVTLHGDYGQTQEAVVTEYIRSEDASGDRGYPGLTIE